MSDESRTGKDRRAQDRRADSQSFDGGERRRGERRVLDRRAAELPIGLHLLDLPQPRAGFSHFIAAWFFVDGLRRKILVDPGPASSVPMLLEKLSAFTDDVDLILLTHIHLDHSGGIAQVCGRYPNAKVLACNRAEKFLAAPQKLWKASLQVLGDVAEMYGEPAPLDTGVLLKQDEVPGVTVLETPGHAPHHLSFIVPFRGKRLFFVGEAAGLFMPMAVDTTLQYLRPASPPKFDAPAAQKSLEKISDVLLDDDLLCFGHWGASRRAKTHVELAKRQLEEWLSAIAKMRDRSEDEITDYLLANDPLLGRYASLPEDLRGRERFFLKNSVRGFVEYIEDSQHSARHV